MQVVCDGKVITVDEDALIEEADEIVHSDYETHQTMYFKHYDKYPAFREMVLKFR